MWKSIFAGRGLAIKYGCGVLCGGARLEAGRRRGRKGRTRGFRTAVRSMCEGRERERDCQTGSENRPGVVQGYITKYGTDLQLKLHASQ